MNKISCGGFLLGDGLMETINEDGQPILKAVSGANYDTLIKILEDEDSDTGYIAEYTGKSFSELKDILDNDGYINVCYIASGNFADATVTYTGNMSVSYLPTNPVDDEDELDNPMYPQINMSGARALGDGVYFCTWTANELTAQFIYNN